MYRAFKLAKAEDGNAILSIIQDAQTYLKTQGIDQWQNNYPNIETINRDIQDNNSYILMEDNVIVGTTALIFGIDPTYNVIHKGRWITNGAYAVIHRIAINLDYHGLGLGTEIIKHAESVCRNKDINSIRVDTHKENKVMQTVLIKNGFVYCGIIYLADGNERMAFEKVLNERLLG